MRSHKSFTCKLISIICHRVYIKIPSVIIPLVQKWHSDQRGFCSLCNFRVEGILIEGILSVPLCHIQNNDIKQWKESIMLLNITKLLLNNRYIMVDTYHCWQVVINPGNYGIEEDIVRYSWQGLNNLSPWWHNDWAFTKLT